MEHHVRSLLGVAMILLSCTACNPTEADIQSSVQWEIELANLDGRTVTELPDRLDAEISDKLSVHAEIRIPEEKGNNEAAELVVKRHVYSDREAEQNLEKLLAIHPDAGQNALQEAEEYQSQEGEDGIERKNYDVELGEYSGVYSGAFGCSFTTKQSESLQCVTIGGFHPESYQFCYAQKQELGFGTWEEAWKQTASLVENLGVDSIVDMQCYTLDLTTLQEKLAERHEQEADYYFIYSAQKAEYTSEDEAYLFEFNQGYDGIPFCRFQLMDALKKQDLGYGLWSDCSAIYSAAGLSDLWVSNLMDIQQIGKPERIVPLSDILEQSIPALSRLATGETRIEVKEIDLCYLPVLKDASKMEFCAIPVWVVAYFQSNPFAGQEDGMIVTDKYDVFNAVTGERMY